MTFVDFYWEIRQYIFLFLHENMLWYSLEAPGLGTSNEYLKHVSWKK